VLPSARRKRRAVRECSERYRRLIGWTGLSFGEKMLFSDLVQDLDELLRSSELSEIIRSAASELASENRCIIIHNAENGKPIEVCDQEIEKLPTLDQALSIEVWSRIAESTSNEFLRDIAERIRLHLSAYTYRTGRDHNNRLTILDKLLTLYQHLEPILKKQT